VDHSEPGDGAEHAYPQTEPAGRPRPLVGLEADKPAVAQDAQRLSRSSWVDPEALGDLAGRGAGYQLAVLGRGVQSDVLQRDPGQGAHLPAQGSAGCRHQQPRFLDAVRPSHDSSSASRVRGVAVVATDGGQPVDRGSGDQDAGAQANRRHPGVAITI
jgi:hypothetical protein